MHFSSRDCHASLAMTLLPSISWRKGDRPLFFREEGQPLSSSSKGLKGTVPKKRGLSPFLYPLFSTFLYLFSAKTLIVLGVKI